MRNFDGFLCVEDADRLPPFKSETPKSRENSRFWAGLDYTLHPTVKKGAEKTKTVIAYKALLCYNAFEN